MGKKNLAGMELCNAVSDGNIEKVKELIENGSKVNIKNISQPPILVATIEGHLEIMEYLIEKGANVKNKDKNGYTSFHHAAESTSVNNVEILQKLIVLAICQNVDGVNIKTSEKTAESHSPLQLAAIKGRLEIMKFLIEDQGADILAVDFWGKTALHLAIKHSPRIEATMYLIEKASSDLINLEDDNGDTSLHLATHLNKFDILKRLIDRSDASINVENKQGYTPLHFAARFCNVDVLKHLIQKGAWIEVKEKGGAAIKSAENYIFLLENGAITTVQDKMKKIPRFYALLYHGEELFAIGKK